MNKQDAELPSNSVFEFGKGIEYVGAKKKYSQLNNSTFVLDVKGQNEIGGDGKMVASACGAGKQNLFDSPFPMETLLNPPFPGHNELPIRRFEPARDLGAIADLVELCFANTLDADGFRYLRQMRTAARNPKLLRIAGRLGEPSSFPLAGFVWEQNGNLIGNLSLIPFQNGRKQVHLIANVAVHPDYRRRGIARELTRAALSHLHQTNGQLPWLQVRDDNPGAQMLYESLGFEERFRRTTWHSTSGAKILTSNHDLKVGEMSSRHWKKYFDWLRKAYPEEMSWHMPFHLQKLRPDLFGFLFRIFNGIFVRQWSAVSGDQPVGGVTWYATNTYFNAVWLGLENRQDIVTAETLLRHVLRNYGGRRPISIELPAGWAEEAMRNCQFVPHQTLVWMRASRWE